MKKQFAFSLFFLISISIFAQKDKLTPETLWSLGRVSLFDVSPDGSSVIYGVTYFDIDENNSTRDLYKVSKYGKDKGLAIRLTDTPEKEGNAQFRPDGKKIGYLKSGFVWEMNIDGSEAKQISQFKVNGFKYSPDMQHILYINDVKYAQTVNELYTDLPKANAKIIDELMYRHWDHWEDESFSNVFYTKYKDGRMGGTGVNIIGEPYDTPLSPFGGLEQVNWSADGQSIAYVSKKMKGKAYAESTNSDIYLYSLESKKTTNLTEFNKGYDLDPVFSPDGRFMAWNSMEKEGYEADRYRAFTLDLETKQVTEITRGYDYNAHSPQWSSDSKSLFYTSERDGTQHIYQITINEGKIRQITKGTYNYYDFIVTEDALVARRASMSEPHEIFSISLTKSGVNPLTTVNKESLSAIEMGKVESKIIKTTDGKEMLVWMIYPPNFDENKKYPALLYCQGGPQSQVSQFWSYRWNFQMMAANDYIIVAPNRRGLPGFGTKWNEEISGDWGGQPMQDYFSAIDEAAKEPYIDENRLGAVGASYGGYSVYWLAGNHNKRFKTFISHCGLFNLESWYGTTEELFFANQDIGGAYWEKTPPKSYAMDSPHKYVQNWDTPILVIHGGKDFRVPLSEGMQAFNVAQMRNIPSRFLYFPEENHWVLSPQNGILWQRVFFEWLDSSLKEK